MARPIRHTPSGPAHDPASAQAAELVTALYESGLLRALTGAARAYPELLGLLLRSLDPAKTTATVTRGRDVLSRLGAAGVAAGAARRLPPPSLRTLLRQASDPDVRRGLAAIIAVVAAVGRRDSDR